jgi:hypothetical protein
MAKTLDNIPCRSCCGTGFQKVSKEYIDTIRVLKTMQPATCLELAFEMEKRGLIGAAMKGTIIHKRMERLRNWGLVRKAKRKRSVKTAKCPAWAFQVV